MYTYIYRLGCPLKVWVSYLDIPEQRLICKTGRWAIAKHREASLKCVHASTFCLMLQVRCNCVECVSSSDVDSLRHSRSRLNIYKALSSPSLIALSSEDPFLTAFRLSWELQELSKVREREAANSGAWASVGKIWFWGAEIPTVCILINLLNFI